MHPTSVTLTSSGVSSWLPLNTAGYSPMNVTFQITVAALSSQYTVEITCDDAQGIFPSSYGIAAFPASAVGGPAISSANQIAGIAVPISAWRLRNTSTGGAVTALALAQGIG
ncbi:hypothetical protein ACQR1W_01870 [Bradyrhizobium sp. HKCCYLS1011]|uniref:hypothetical protein n=1 Tax=Bradyrhizobium sp. HKCCYLS1011 TaxID=3420733 RepID=UPI003EBE9C77